MTAHLPFSMDRAIPAVFVVLWASGFLVARTVARHAEPLTSHRTVRSHNAGVLRHRDRVPGGLALDASRLERCAHKRRSSTRRVSRWRVLGAAIQIKGGRDHPRLPRPVEWGGLAVCPVC